MNCFNGDKRTKVFKNNLNKLKCGLHFGHASYRSLGLQLNQFQLKYFQYELEILHEHVAPVPLAIRRRNQQQRRPSSEDFLEAMEAKRNGGIIRNQADHVMTLIY